jgi:hypothetical protein
MFLLSRSSAVGSFTPPALPGFFAIPVPIPCEWPFVVLRVIVVSTYSAWLSLPCQEPSSLAWFILRLYVLLDAVCDPGAESGSRLLRASLCCLLPLARHLPFPILISGLTTRFSVLRFTSQPLFALVSPPHLRCRVSVITLSVVIRVPSYSLALPSSSAPIPDG